MIIKASERGNAYNLADHLTNAQDNEHMGNNNSVTPTASYDV